MEGHNRGLLWVQFHFPSRHQSVHACLERRKAVAEHTFGERDLARLKEHFATSKAVQA
jgi:hypothetical protein